jgi:hypothetical protein
VVFHKAIGEDGYAETAAEQVQDPQIEDSVGIREKDPLPAIPPVDDVVRDAGKYHTSKSGHCRWPEKDKFLLFLRAIRGRRGARIISLYKFAPWLCAAHIRSSKEYQWDAQPPAEFDGYGVAPRRSGEAPRCACKAEQSNEESARFPPWKYFRYANDLGKEISRRDIWAKTEMREHETCPQKKSTVPLEGGGRCGFRCLREVLCGLCLP